MQDLFQKDFMKHDAYLLRWLTVANFDLDEAVRRFKKSMKWRTANKIDQIFLENFGSIDEEYRVTVSGFDKDGRPRKRLNT